MTIQEWLAQSKRVEDERPMGSNWIATREGALTIQRADYSIEEAATLAREILAACGETKPVEHVCKTVTCARCEHSAVYCIAHSMSLPPRGRKLADMQPCGCVIAGERPEYRFVRDLCDGHSSALALAEDPNAVWVGEAAPMDAAAVREAAIREAAETLRANGEYQAVAALSALLPGKTADTVTVPRSVGTSSTATTHTIKHDGSKLPDTTEARLLAAALLESIGFKVVDRWAWEANEARKRLIKAHNLGACGGFKVCTYPGGPDAHRADIAAAQLDGAK